MFFTEHNYGMEILGIAFFLCPCSEAITSEFCEDLTQIRTKKGSVKLVLQHCMSNLLLLWGLALVKQDPS